MNKTIHQEIEDFATYLKMPVLKRGYREAIQEANTKKTSYEPVLMGTATKRMRQAPRKR